MSTIMPSAYRGIVGPKGYIDSPGESVYSAIFHRFPSTAAQYYNLQCAANLNEIATAILYFYQ